MPKELVVGAFEILAPTFLSNAWSHPDSATEGFADLAYWQDLARVLDAGGFDFLFFAEALGYPMDEDGPSPVAVREGVQFPVLEPLSVITGLAAVAPRLGFVVTASTTAERPYLNARRFATVDHLTGGRIGWNVVTSDMQAALVRLLGETSITPHDQRYARAEEFVDLSLKLWEGSWEDGALVFDKDSRTMVDPAKVHEVHHDGEHFRLHGLFPVPPSPQRTPTLFQAGASPRGRDFAARIAECVFVQEREVAKAAAVVADLRARAVAHRRRADSIKLVNGISIVVADTEAEAVEARRALTAAPSREAMATLFAGWSGVNLLALDPDASLADISTEVGQTLLSQHQDPSMTVGDIMDTLAETMGGFKVTGTPEQCAEQIEQIVTATDIDGLLIEHSIGGADSYRDVIDTVFPLLRERGLLPPEPRAGSLRERLTGTSTPLLPDDHPGARHRR